jgi:hypothetical protein
MEPSNEQPNPLIEQEPVTVENREEGSEELAETLTTVAEELSEAFEGVSTEDLLPMLRGLDGEEIMANRVASEKYTAEQLSVATRLRQWARKNTKTLRFMSSLLLALNVTNNALADEGTAAFDARVLENLNSSTNVEYTDPGLLDGPDGGDGPDLERYVPGAESELQVGPEASEGYEIIKTINITDAFEHGQGSFDAGRAEIIRQAIANSLSEILADPDYEDFLRDGKITIRVSSDITYGAVDIDGDGTISGPRETSGSTTDTDRGSVMSKYNNVTGQGYDYLQAKAYNTNLSNERAQNTEALVRQIITEMVPPDIAPNILVEVDVPKYGQPTPADLHGPGESEYQPQDLVEDELAKQRYAYIVFEEPEKAPEPDVHKGYLLDISPSMVNDARVYLEDWANTAAREARARGDDYRVEINIQPFAQGETDPDLGDAFTSKPAVPAHRDGLSGPYIPRQEGEAYSEITVVLTGDRRHDQQVIDQTVERLERLSNTARSNETAILAVEDYLEKHPRRAEIIAGEYQLELGTDEPLQDVNMQVLEHLMRDYPDADITFVVKSQVDNPRFDPTRPTVEGTITQRISLQDLYHITAGLIAGDPQLSSADLSNSLLSVYPFESHDGTITWQIERTLEPHANPYNRTSLNVADRYQNAEMSQADREAYGIGGGSEN